MDQLSDTGLKPARILDALKKLHLDKMILATITTIYSARKKATKVDESGKIKGLFFCHNLSIQHLTHYHHVLLLDCTYMTNKHKMPLLHITGVTGANTSFSAAFCFLAEETQGFYDWALKTFLTIFTAHNIRMAPVDPGTRWHPGTSWFFPQKWGPGTTPGTAGRVPRVFEAGTAGTPSQRPATEACLHVGRQASAPPVNRKD
ncbi:hypothetical protein PSTG_04733 [Puccinia striiformis f. sp. tritici PST-78]|uniref:MULE transposase domain-containing protein n=1 Tax=Puccinia striiformis f. sp. tritici PST-78 TaxID=1165861 RepID=A0A0L0VRL4_9BASI|nr:hypothetical protein PSTG_04733 [Puccinia striiformis f. sp. tritici PST-78]